MKGALNNDRRQAVRDYCGGEKRRRERRQTIRNAQVTHFCDRFYYAALAAGNTYDAVK